MNIFARTHKASGTGLVESPSFTAEPQILELSPAELDAVGGGDIVGNYDSPPKP